MLHDSLWIKEKYHPTWRQKLNRAKNFFKHADNDLGGVVEFSLEEAVGHMLFSIIALELDGSEKNEYECAFIIWLKLSRSELLTEKGRKWFSHNVSLSSFEALRGSAKSVFYDAYVVEPRGVLLKNS